MLNPALPSCMPWYYLLTGRFCGPVLSCAVAHETRTSYRRPLFCKEEALLSQRLVALPTITRVVIVAGAVSQTLSIT